MNLQILDKSVIFIIKVLKRVALTHNVLKICVIIRYNLENFR